MAVVKKPAERVALLDEIRGFCIVCMVFYHGFYLLDSIAGIAFCGTLYRFFEPVQLLFASVFIAISGVCTQFSRSVLRRGAILLCIALTLTVVTVCILPRFGLDGMQDRFGILHLLACCMLLHGVFGNPLRRIPPVWGACGCAALYLITRRILFGQIGIAGLHLNLPSALLQTRFLFPLGLHDARFVSADYFPLLPHMFMFLFGSFVGNVLSEHGWPASVCRVHARPFAFCGRHSLWIYLLHAPVWIALAVCIRHFTA